MTKVTPRGPNEAASPAPEQPFEASRWIDALGAEAEDSLVALLWRKVRD